MPNGVLPQYSNRHLIEINCGFQFPNETMEWDSTFFGLYYEKIKELGFVEKQQRKGVQIKFEGNLIDTDKSPLTTSQIEDQVVFRNNDKTWAILMGKGKISFHVIKGYTVWNDFLKNFVQPYINIYKSIGLGNGLHQCSIVYLNSFIKPQSAKLSDYFTLLSPLDPKFGVESNTFVQRVVSSNDNLLIAKFNSVLNNDNFTINLECGSVCANATSMENLDWLEQANKTHMPIKEFFESLITDKLRKEL